MKVIPETRHAR